MAKWFALRMEYGRCRCSEGVEGIWENYSRVGQAGRGIYLNCVVVVVTGRYGRGLTNMFQTLEESKRPRVWFVSCREKLGFFIKQRGLDCFRIDLTALAIVDWFGLAFVLLRRSDLEGNERSHGFCEQSRVADRRLVCGRSSYHNDVPYGEAEGMRGGGWLGIGKMGIVVSLRCTSLGRSVRVAAYSSTVITH